jgi:hypothetical protein
MTPRKLARSPTLNARQHTGHLGPIHSPIQSSIHGHPTGPMRTKPTRYTKAEMARDRPIHYELQKDDSRSRVCPGRSPNYPNVYRRPTQQHRSGRYQISPSLHLPRNCPTSYRQCQVKRTDERTNKKKGREDQPTKLAVPNRTTSRTATSEPPSQQPPMIQLLQCPADL